MSQAGSAAGSPLRRVPSHSASQRKSYIDPADDSGSEEDEVVQIQSDNKRKRIASTPVSAQSDAEEADDEEYEIDYIVDSRNRRFRGQNNLEFFIHWKGYEKKDRSWTDATQFEADDPPVVDFYKKDPSKPGAEHFGLAKTKAKIVKKVTEVVSSDDEIQIDDTRDKKAAAPPSPTTAKTPRSNKPVMPDSSGRKLNGGDLRSFFSKTPASGKENKQVPSGWPVSKTAPAKPKPTKIEAKPPAKKKRKTDSDESDFVLEDGGAAAESEVESDGDASAAEASDSEADDDDVSIAEERKPAKKQAGWNKNTGGKVVKKPKVHLNGYKTGVKPLPGNENIKTAIKNVSENLPPLHDVELMFDHLVSRVPAVTKLVDRLNGRKLRLATMCSGTESPLLALNMISKAIKEQHGLTLGFEHVFSCEIEPFKQAYIERNFAPPILFRDVTELGKKKAHTAYGSLVDVPGNVDVLIAGTSCVDYSNLNNKQQDIEANGESGRTFRGMLQWVKKNQPPIVILENVCSAPWDKVVEYFAQIDYDASFLRLDTKEFYIPHTRTRVYLFATPQKASSVSHVAAKWEATVQDMKRPWSSPFEALMLSHDDPNIHRARLDLASAKDLKDGPSRKPTDWNRCESRHQRARQEEQLGLLRPLTAWQEAGVCKGLDWTWNDWLQSQTERVVDLLDISTLRMAKEGIDPGYKACIWNVSQNVDRQAGSGKTALSPCLTPNMIAWVTNRGGPITGREALALQGIPVRELLLTSENEDQLADLAGNAMTTTVVGSCVLAGLMVALDRLPQGDGIKEEQTVDDEISTHITGEKSLQRNELDLAKVSVADLKKIMDLAERSSRHCQCEGQSGTASPIDKCTACGYRACKSCGGRPDHHYVPCTDDRVEPSDFERRFKDLLPMRVQVAGVTKETIQAVRIEAEKKGKGEVDEKDWKLWSEAVLEGITDAEFRFRYLRRQFTWTAVYEAPHARLDLVLQNKLPEWRLTIKTPIDEAVNSRLRALLLHPVARMRFNISGQDVLCGPWELCVPTRQSFKVDIKGAGELVPSWHASLGLLGEHEGKQRWSQLNITVPEGNASCLDRSISGTYTLLPKCGQAMTSLHIKERDDKDDGLPDLFFFLDPTRCGEADDDVYVFSTSTDRLEYGTERATIATLESKWRESSRPSETVKMDVRGGWIMCEAAHLTAVGGSDIVVAKDDTETKRDTATYAVPAQALQVTDSCKHASALLSCSVPLDRAHSEAMWKQGAWGEIDIPHQGNTTFANLAWITERLPALDNFTSWTAIEGSNESCERCAPKKPKIHWIKRNGKLNKNGGKTKATIVAFEDKLEAGRYEHALKHRPAPFVVQLRLDKDVGSFRIGLNIVSLAHRASSRLPSGATRLSWRLTPGQVADVPQPPRVFLMPSNKRDPQHGQPQGFVLPLRKEQLRSLWWMLKQESATEPTFVEEEISEAALPSLGWLAEGKAERPVLVRGGVIADQVGYGKTIISLALIAESRKKAAPEPAPKGLIDLKATLIVVPGHLSKQWPSEIERFTGNMFKVVVIQNMRDLNTRSISEFAKADIIVMASEIFDADAYWSRFEYLSAQPEEWLSDKSGGRFFSDRLDAAIATLRDQTARLKDEGSQAVLDHMEECQEKARKEAEEQREAQKTAQYGKRQKGQAYRDRYDALDGKKTKKVTAEEVQKWEASEDEEEEEIEALPVPTYRKASGTESFNSSSVKKDSHLLSSPVMHMFRFRRVIADEFTYLEKKGLAALLRLQSSYKWVLSGTPPVSDFPAIRSIAAFMGIHLGVEDDAEGTAQHQKQRAKEQTDAEKFHAFREVHSAAWHRRRDDLAQEFLDKFVRQNIAEIDDIPTVEHVHHIKLPASEGAVYLELEHHLQALEMQARKETKFKNVTQGDRNARLEEALADSKTAEEALLKRCCHFTLDLTDTKREAKSAHEACEHISDARSSQLKGCEDDLYRSINSAVALHLYIRKKGFFGKSDEDRQHFKEFIDFSFDRTKHQGDREAAQRLIAVLQRCGFAEDGSFPTTTADGKSAKVESGAKVEDVKWELREQSHLLRRLSKELVARVRSLRFFGVVRKLQKNGKDAKDVVEESGCSHKPSTHPTIEMAVLSCCGHIACVDCMKQAADLQTCIMGSECSAAVRQTNIVKVGSLGIEGELSSGRYGAKLQKMVDLIQSIPKRERILVFLQWEDLAKKVSEALTAGGIRHETLSGSVKSRANTLDKFQRGDADTARVLLLKMNDASAAGSNLTTANHAIFLGPLFTQSLLNYRAVETQAIGRVRRYGQQRKVHIHRLLALDTIDTAIFDSRTAELRAKADHVEIPKEEYDGKASKRAAAEDGDRPAKKAKRDEEPIEID